MTPDQAAKLRSALAQGDWAAAETLLRRLAARRDAPAAVFYNLGQVLARAGRPEQSGAWYRRALAADPGHADAWAEYAAWLAARGEVAAAIDALRKMLERRPADVAAWRDLARLLLRAGRWEEARAAWNALPADTSGEAQIALLRIALETGDPAARDLRRQLAGRAELRPALLKAITRTARGALPLKPADL